MDNSEELLKTIYTCIDELNQQLPEDGKLAKAPDSILIGEGGVLDSLGLITLLVNIEQALSERNGITAALLDEMMAEHQGQHPFHSIGAMVSWIGNAKPSQTT